MPGKAPNLVDRHVGSRVRMRRIMLGMSQRKNSAKVWASHSSRFRNTKKAPTASAPAAFNRSSEILQIPVSFLFEGSPGGIGRRGRF